MIFNPSVRILGALAACIATAVSPSALAGSVTGPVSQYMTGAQGANATFLFYINGTITGKPVCNSRNGFSVNTTTAGGAGAREAVIAASTSGQSVTVTGTGVCTIGAGFEDTYSVVANGLVPPAPVQPIMGVVAVCVSSNGHANGDCSCLDGKSLIPKQFSYGSVPCAVVSSTGPSCQASGAYNAIDHKYGSCCLCKY